MRFGPLKAAWRRAYRRLRDGHVLRLGPVAIVRARLLDNLMLRIAGRPELKPWGAYKDPLGMADLFELTD